MSYEWFNLLYKLYVAFEFFFNAFPRFMFAAALGLACSNRILTRRETGYCWNREIATNKKPQQLYFATDGWQIACFALSLLLTVGYFPDWNVLLICFPSLLFFFFSLPLYLFSHNFRIKNGSPNLRARLQNPVIFQTNRWLLYLIHTRNAFQKGQLKIPQNGPSLYTVL